MLRAEIRSRRTSLPRPRTHSQRRGSLYSNNIPSYITTSLASSHLTSIEPPHRRTFAAILTATLHLSNPLLLASHHSLRLFSSAKVSLATTPHSTCSFSSAAALPSISRPDIVRDEVRRHLLLSRSPLRLAVSSLPVHTHTRVRCCVRLIARSLTRAVLTPPLRSVASALAERSRVATVAPNASRLLCSIL